VQVAFDIDANGILSVSAKDKATGKEQSIKIEASSGLSKEDIDKMKDDAKKHADEDKVRRDEIDLRNEADGKAHQTRKQLEELKEQISEDDRKALETKVEALEQALKEDNLDMIKSANDDLTKTWSEVSTRMYQQGEGQPGAEGFDPNAAGEQADAESAGDDDVETADYEVVDEDEK
jgi:molecular chaperone DnaK